MSECLSYALGALIAGGGLGVIVMAILIVGADVRRERRGR